LNNWWTLCVGRGRPAQTSALHPTRAAMIRPQLKDMYMSGMDARISSLDKKSAAALQPPMNASPGELRLWRKLNGLLDDNEKKVDAHEHSKAKSRQMKYPGTPARQAAAVQAKSTTGKSGVSENEYLYGDEHLRQQGRQQGNPPAAPGQRRASTGCAPAPRAPTASKEPRRHSSASPQSSPKAMRPPTPTRKATQSKARAESPGRARPAVRRPSPRDGSPRAMPPRAPQAVERKPRPAIAAPTRHREAAYTSEEEASSRSGGEEGGAEDQYDEYAASAEGEDDACAAEPYTSDPPSVSSLEQEYVEEHASESKTPSPVATGAEAASKKRARAGNTAGGSGDRVAMTQIEELLQSLSLEQKKALHGRLSDLIEMHELRQMIHN